MLDYKFEGMVYAHTVGELLEQLESVADETPIRPEGGLWAGVSKFAVREETFIDAFDRTVYQHDVYIPTDGDGEFCFGLYHGEADDFLGYHHVSTAGDLKRYLKEKVPPEFKAISVDDNFELGGAITEKVKFLLIRRDELTLEFR
jgi:hypothetical protein